MHLLKKYLLILFLLLLPVAAFAAEDLPVKKSHHPSQQHSSKKKKLKKRHYQVACCAIFRNEAPWLREWIEYHKLIGIEHFYLYNNLSNDNYEEVLKPYVDSGEVDLINWPYESRSFKHWMKIQADAYRHAILKAKKRARWLAILDTDEFIVMTQEENLATFLKPYEKYGGIGIHWQLFGTSDVEKIPADKLMIEMLVMKAPDDYGENAFIKSIVRPKKVQKIGDAHYAKFKKGYFHVDSNFNRIVQSIKYEIVVDKIRINHYWTRDEDYFYNKKCPRRQGWAEGFDGQLNRKVAVNIVPDLFIQRYVTLLREKLGLPGN